MLAGGLGRPTAWEAGCIISRLGPDSVEGRSPALPSRSSQRAPPLGQGLGASAAAPQPGLGPDAWAGRAGRTAPTGPRRRSHAPSPSPFSSFFPRSAPGSRRRTRAALSERSSFVCARGPGASLGRPNLAAPGRLPSGSCEAWLGEGGARGRVGLPGRREGLSHPCWTMSLAARRCGHF